MQSNKDTGNLGEDLATIALQERGFTILERNWQFRYWEVDIIASVENRLHFIEVKTRKSLRYGYPEESITREKMNSLKNAAEAYLEANPEWKYIQFDVVAITITDSVLRELKMYIFNTLTTFPAFFLPFGKWPDNTRYFAGAREYSRSFFSFSGAEIQHNRPVEPRRYCKNEWFYLRTGKAVVYSSSPLLFCRR